MTSAKINIHINISTVYTMSCANFAYYQKEMMQQLRLEYYDNEL